MQEVVQKKFYDWTIRVETSHILGSVCSNELCKKETDLKKKCEFCQFSDKSINFGHLPDMVYSKNRLCLVHEKTRFQIDFNAFDALKAISFEPSIDKFDWTYETSYNGTISEHVTIEKSDQLIDKTKLVSRDEILFYEDVILYEDELNDLGVSWCRVKIRVMPSVLFILLRYFLRVDNDRVKLRDTRYFHEFSKPYLIREIQLRELNLKESPSVLSRNVLLDPNSLYEVLPQVFYTNEKISF